MEGAESHFDIVFERCFNKIIRCIPKVDRDNYERYAEKIYEKYEPSNDVKRASNALFRISRWFILDYPSEFVANDLC